MHHTALCYVTTTAGLILLFALVDGNTRLAGDALIAGLLVAGAALYSIRRAT